MYQDIKRNKIKRLIRENYRLLEDKISVGYDIIFLWKKTKTCFFLQPKS